MKGAALASTWGASSTRSLTQSADDEGARVPGGGAGGWAGSGVPLVTAPLDFEDFALQHSSVDLGGVAVGHSEWGMGHLGWGSLREGAMSVPLVDARLAVYDDLHLQRRATDVGVGRGGGGRGGGGGGGGDKTKLPTIGVARRGDGVGGWTGGRVGARRLEKNPATTKKTASPFVAESRLVRRGGGVGGEGERDRARLQGGKKADMGSGHLAVSRRLARAEIRLEQGVLEHKVPAITPARDPAAAAGPAVGAQLRAASR